MFVDFARIPTLLFEFVVLPLPIYLQTDSLTERIWFKNYLERAHALPSAIFVIFSRYAATQVPFGSERVLEFLCAVINPQKKKSRALKHYWLYLLLTGDLLFNYLIIFYRLLGALCRFAKHTTQTAHIQHTAIHVNCAHDSQLSCWANNKLNLKTKGTEWTHAECQIRYLDTARLKFTCALWESADGYNFYCLCNRQQQNSRKKQMNFVFRHTTARN